MGVKLACHRADEPVTVFCRNVFFKERIMGIHQGGKLLIAAVAASLLPFSAGATLVDNGDITLDDVTSLEWLDLTRTRGQSYSSILGQLSTIEGGGWRYATRSEVVDVAGQFGVPNISNQAVDSGYANSVGSWATMMGATVGPFNSNFWETGIFGLIQEGSTTALHYRFGAEAKPTTGDYNIRMDAGPRAEYTDAQTSSFFGHWLVREVNSGPTGNDVPEPSALALLLLSLGIAGAVSARRRRGG
jgi:hypothetical protein